MTNIEIQKYYQNESRFNGVCSRNHLSKNIKDGAYVVNLDEYADVEAHWIAMFQVMMLLILIVLKLNMFLKKLSILLEIKICKQTYLEYKQINQ